MTMFVVANLGDATYNLATGTINSSSLLTTGGITFVNNTTAAPITVTVEAGLTFVLIKDVAYNANLYPITIIASDGSNIEQAASLVLTVPGQWVWLSYNGSYFSVIG